MPAVLKWKLWNVVSRSQYLQLRADTQYVGYYVQQLCTVVAFSLGVGLASFPEPHRALLWKMSCLLPGVAAIVKQSACGSLKANQMSTCGHWFLAFDAHLGNEKATSSTLWTFSHLSTLSIITVSINCMSMQSHELCGPSFTGKLSYWKEHAFIHRTASMVKKVFSSKPYVQEMQAPSI